jgi:hypothetical protein
MTQERTMKQAIQRHHWKQAPESDSMDKEKQQTIDGKYKYYSKSYLVESFVLNSPERVIVKKGKGFRPDPSFSKKSTPLQPQLKALRSIVRGKKVKELDIQTLTSVFEQYTECVNLLLVRMYRDQDRVELLGQCLAEYKGRAYTLLRKEKDLSYQHNDEIKQLVFERLYRNALEHAGRTLLAD